MAGAIRRMMVYLDGSEESLAAAAYAVVLAHQTRAALHALYVVNTRALSDLVTARIFLASEQDEYQHDLETDAARYLNYAVKLGADRGVSVEPIRSEGTVNQEIKAKVEEMEIDLLVIGELARIRSRRDEFFDETERAMRSVECSVLIVKDEERVWDLYESL
jgi:nucleotide-binding universal stress UspA family protein